METADEVLLQQFRAGDDRAGGALYDRHSRGLFAWILSIGQSRALAEDVVQESFLRLFAYDPDREVESVKAFLYTVGRNLLRDQRRREATRRDRLALVARPNIAEDELFARDASEALELLPQDQREVVVLKIYGNFTFSEIGELTETGTSTAASRYRLAMEKLADQITNTKGTR